MRGFRSQSLGGVWGPAQVEVRPVAGRCGSGRVGNVLVRYDVLCLVWRDGGKKFVSSGRRRHVDLMAGDRMVRIISSSRYAARPNSLAMMISYTGHLAGLSTMVSSSACLSDGIKRMCPLGMRKSVDMFV